MRRVAPLARGPFGPICATASTCNFTDRVDRILDDFSDDALKRERERLDRMITWIESHGKARHYLLRARRALVDGVVEARPDPALWKAPQPMKDKTKEEST